MTIDRRTLIAGAVGMTIAGRASAQEWGPPAPADTATDRPQWPPAEHFPLWPGLPPGAPAKLPVPHDTMNGPAGNRQLWLYGIPQPIVAIYRPQKPDGRAILSIPGGGYGFVSVHNEGIDVAQTFTPHGVTVFVLAYRLPGEGWADRANVPLQDAQRAMRLIRARAATWQVDSAKLGILGFSAGGHLGASLTVGHDDPVYRPVDAADTLSAKPAFSGLIYPVIDLSFDPKGSSTRNLLGPEPTAAQFARYDTSKRVTAATPPMFLAQALDDPLVAPEHSLAMLSAARQAKVPVAAHLFQEGGHGFGPRRMATGLPAAMWPELFRLWMDRHVRS